MDCYRVKFRVNLLFFFRRLIVCFDVFTDNGTGRSPNVSSMYGSTKADACDIVWPSLLRDMHP